MPNNQVRTAAELQEDKISDIITKALDRQAAKERETREEEKQDIVQKIQTSNKEAYELLANRLTKMQERHVAWRSRNSKLPQENFTQ